ncbi:hypothetical protein [Tritonibacter mobilis]|uniref:hypothetical protein n=1 Tax=Tritonibacter mobilis TaxID=379347 RepID=UPI001CD97569|nr:hypothetical protein [Tritonibacter mobilis]MCA2009143.1 hypothetical protein [Tritonibacter mobilis]
MTTHHIPTRAQREAAQEEAYRIAPLPQTSEALAAVLSFFGGGIFAFVILLLAGVDTETYPHSAIAPGIGILCGIIGYLVIRSQTQAHYRALREIMSG